MRTNICLQSEDLSTTWTNALSVDTQSEGASPDGTNTANKLIDDNGGGTGGCDIVQALTITTGTTFVLSVYLKKDQLNWSKIAIDNLGTLAISAFFDLANGAVGASQGADNTSAFIQDVGDGWFRCGIVFESDASDSSGVIKIRPANANNNSVVDRDNTSSIFVWGAQLETRSFASPYIPTTTATVSRSEDPFILSSSMMWLN